MNLLPGSVVQTSSSTVLNRGHVYNIPNTVNIPNAAQASVDTIKVALGQAKENSQEPLQTKIFRAIFENYKLLTTAAKARGGKISAQQQDLFIQEVLHCAQSAALLNPRDVEIELATRSGILSLSGNPTEQNMQRIADAIVKRFDAGNIEILDRRAERQSFVVTDTEKTTGYCGEAASTQISEKAVSVPVVKGEQKALRRRSTETLAVDTGVAARLFSKQASNDDILNAPPLETFATSMVTALLACVGECKPNEDKATVNARLNAEMNAQKSLLKTAYLGVMPASVKLEFLNSVESLLRQHNLIRSSDTSTRALFHQTLGPLDDMTSEIAKRFVDGDIKLSSQVANGDLVAVTTTPASYEGNVTSHDFSVTQVTLKLVVGSLKLTQAQTRRPVR